MGAVWQVIVSGTEQQQAEAAEILADTRRRLYGLLAEGGRRTRTSMSDVGSESTGPELRIGDAEREAAVTALGEHYAAGRLTKEEYDERGRPGLGGPDASALWPLFADLPRPRRPARRPAAAAAAPGRPSGLVVRRPAGAPVLLVRARAGRAHQLPWFLLVGWCGCCGLRMLRHWGRRRRPPPPYGWLR